MLLGGVPAFAFTTTVTEGSGCQRLDSKIAIAAPAAAMEQRTRVVRFPHLWERDTMFGTGGSMRRMATRTATIAMVPSSAMTA
jgi:hypothetical protein